MWEPDVLAPLASGCSGGVAPLRRLPAATDQKGATPVSIENRISVTRSETLASQLRGGNSPRAASTMKRLLIPYKAHERATRGAEAPDRLHVIDMAIQIARLRHPHALLIY